MTFQQKLKFEDIAPSFDRILTEYQRISKAPSFSDLLERSDKTGASLDAIMRAESSKQYKALDTRTGDIFLCENPAMMTYQSFIFEQKNIPNGTITRRKPKFLMSYEDAKQLIKNLDQGRNATTLLEIDYNEGRPRL